jgi:hypothetical protein
MWCQSLDSQVQMEDQATWHLVLGATSRHSPAFLFEYYNSYEVAKTNYTISDHPMYDERAKETEQVHQWTVCVCSVSDHS